MTLIGCIALLALEEPPFCPHCLTFYFLPRFQQSRQNLDTTYLLFPFVRSCKIPPFSVCFMEMISVRKDVAQEQKERDDGEREWEKWKEQRSGRGGEISPAGADGATEWEEEVREWCGWNPKLTMPHVQLRLVMYTGHAVLFGLIVIDANMMTADMGTKYVIATTMRTLVALMPLRIGERPGMFTMVAISREAGKTLSATTAAYATMNNTTVDPSTNVRKPLPLDIHPRGWKVRHDKYASHFSGGRSRSPRLLPPETPRKAGPRRETHDPIVRLQSPATALVLLRFYLGCRGDTRCSHGTIHFFQFRVAACVELFLR